MGNMNWIVPSAKYSSQGARKLSPTDRRGSRPSLASRTWEGLTGTQGHSRANVPQLFPLIRTQQRLSHEKVWLWGRGWTMKLIPPDTNSGWVVAHLPISKADLTTTKPAMLMVVVVVVVGAVDVCSGLWQRKLFQTRNAVPGMGLHHKKIPLQRETIVTWPCILWI